MNTLGRYAALHGVTDYIYLRIIGLYHAGMREHLFRFQFVNGFFVEFSRRKKLATVKHGV